MTEFILTGPNGANPLGFLCALGTLRTLTNACPNADTKMAWTQIGAAWRPVLRTDHASFDGKSDAEAKDIVVQILYAELQEMEGHPAMHWEGTHAIPAQEFRDFASQSVEHFFANQSEIGTSWAATIACDAVCDDDVVKDTAFRTMSGQGHQLFLKQMRLLKDAVQPQHISEALFNWQYRDEKLNLRFEPIEDRRHALRWTSPNKDAIKTVWGANLLASHGLPLYPVFPVGRKLETSGFTGHKKDNTFWTWPIWSRFASERVVRSTLLMSELQLPKPNRKVLLARGIVDVYRSQRIMVGKFRAFTSPHPL